MLFASLTLWSAAALASLGGDVSSVKADYDHMEASSLKSIATASYALHEMQTSKGTTVREYVSPAGTVFAVAWKGPSVPDLQQLLGSHFNDYQTAMQDPNRRPSHGPTTIRVENLVVELSGHMRDFQGRAYLADQLPAGVALESIR